MIRPYPPSLVTWFIQINHYMGSQWLWVLQSTSLKVAVNCNYEFTEHFYDSSSAYALDTSALTLIPSGLPRGDSRPEVINNSKKKTIVDKKQ